MLFNCTTVEAVVLLSNKNPDIHINVKVEFGEGDGKIPVVLYEELNVVEELEYSYCSVMPERIESIKDVLRHFENGMRSIAADIVLAAISFELVWKICFSYGIGIRGEVTWQEGQGGTHLVILLKIPLRNF